MKLLRIAIAAAFAFGFGTAYAFHSGGVAECGGCHSMHSPAAGGSFLLVGVDQTSTCLSCHQHAGDTGPNNYHISTAEADMPAGSAPLQRTPGGDFGWLKKTYYYNLRGAKTEWGDSHGHNIVAPGLGYNADATNTTAPGGTFLASGLACNSCHDPHGKYRRAAGDTVANSGAAIKTSGSYAGAVIADNEPGTAPDGSAYAVGVYRLLAGAGYVKAPYPGVPPAKVPSAYNRSEAASSTRVAYGAAITAAGNTTWGNWCGTCHPNMHSANGYVHPVDQQLGSTIALNYNTYVKSGDMTGTPATSFTSLVPFATDGTGNTYANLAAVTASTAGPASADRVMCLSCHRAHASGFPFMLRWNMESELLTWDGAYSADPKFGQGKTVGEIQAAYYDRPATVFAAYQRVLCNKCHAKD